MRKQKHFTGNKQLRGVYLFGVEFSFFYVETYDMPRAFFDHRLAKTHTQQSGPRRQTPNRGSTHFLDKVSLFCHACWDNRHVMSASAYGPVVCTTSSHALLLFRNDAPWRLIFLLSPVCLSSGYLSRNVTLRRFPFQLFLCFSSPFRFLHWLN
jgi:hypothetical protein